MTTHRGDRTLAERTARPATLEPEQLLTPVWVRDAGRSIPGVLLTWRQEGQTWWGLVAVDVGRGPERTWIEAGRLAKIATR